MAKPGLPDAALHWRLPPGVLLAASASEPRAAKAPIAVDLFAGTLAGVAQLAVGHPFDTVKVKLQNMAAAQPGQAPLYASALDAARKTVAADGPLGLYAGVSAPLAFVAVFNAVLFAANATMRTLVARPGQSHVDDLSMPQLAACGAGAGFAVAWVATPTELVKCRLQSQATAPAARVYAGPIDCARQVAAARGFGGLYKGLGATLLRELPANAVYFGTYEACKRAQIPKHATSTDALGPGALVLSGGTAGIAFWAGVYPVDVIKTRLQTDSDLNPRYRGILDCARQTIKTEGFGALYRGVGPCLARAFPANGVTFLVFEWAKSALVKGPARRD
jgi:solute carrier family 25 (mitochondrial carnitine/acylcarnitine transporter), member 20/29